MAGREDDYSKGPCIISLAVENKACLHSGRGARSLTHLKQHSIPGAWHEENNKSNRRK